MQSQSINYLIVFNMSVANNVSEKNDKTLPVGADYETAISATGFGKFNLCLILILIISGWAISFESSTMSYVFPAAQCDLDLNLEDKGLLNAITYAGMVSSAVAWGFLFDTLGRRKLLLIGFTCDALCVIISAFSQNKHMLVAMKFFGGFIINGPYAALSSYISEFQCAKYRARMQLCFGVAFGIGGIVMPLTAWAVLPQNIHFSIHSLDFHSWNIFLLIFSLPSLLSAIIFSFMPETPKFLMTIGENEKALALFQKIYSMNSNRPSNEYPIRQLVDEIALKKSDPKAAAQITAKRSQSEALKEGWQQVKPLFKAPHLPRILLVCVVQAIFTMNVNTLRLWLPQIFQAMNDYEYLMHEPATDVCKSLEVMRPSNSTGDSCEINMGNAEVYTNSVIVGGFSVVSYLLSGIFINTLGKKKLLCILGVICASFSIGIYFASSATQVVIFSSLFTSAAAIPVNIMLSIIIDVFPTTLRTMSLALALMSGRAAAVGGNFLFPILVNSGCAPPFITFTAITVAGVLLAMGLPNTDLKPLE